MVVITAATLMCVGATVADADDAGGSDGPARALRAVVYHGLRVSVPQSWAVVDFSARPHACLRLDRPAVYLGPAGDQRACPAHLVGGAPALQLQPLAVASVADDRPSILRVASGRALRSVRLPSRGPVTVAIEPAGVLLSAAYGDVRAASLLQRVVGSSVVQSDAVPTLLGPGTGETTAAGGASAPGSYKGKGFDACTAPSQALMDAWRSSSDYASVGVYIGGISRGCGQPNLTPAWVSHQVDNGWHLVPTYVGRQAPCTSFTHRISYDPATARAQGRAEATDAVAQAQVLGIAAPSTVYADIEGYDNTRPSCVASVLSYVSGWTYELENNGFMAGVYSSASSGMRDLAAHHDDRSYTRPDDIWMAWWNGLADVDGGSYVPDSLWRRSQRVHQYAGNVTETHGGFTLQIDRNFLDVSTSVHPPRGCPTNLDFDSYPTVTWDSKGRNVAAVQCLLARAGFDPGSANGKFEWRTASAVRAFKAAVGLTSRDAVVRRWVWTALLSAGSTEFLERGSHGSRVRKVQRALTARLATTVEISGRFDGVTARRVQEYQRLVGLTATGTVGAPTWNALHAGR